MNSAEARDRFSDALDGELSVQEQADFDTALERDEALRQDFEELRSLLKGVHALRKIDEEVHLLVGVHEKLRARGLRKSPREQAKDLSNRFLRPMIWALWLLLLVLIVIAALQLFELDEGAPRPEVVPTQQHSDPELRRSG